MAEVPSGVLAERDGQGQEIYVQSMEKSVEAKAKEIFPWVKPGVIVDAGAGAGPLTDLLSKSFPGSTIVALDMSSDMIDRLNRRFEGRKNVEVVHGDIDSFRYREPVSTFINVSVFHEDFSFNGYSHEKIIKTLIRQKQALEKGGVDIIRDGVQPEQEVLYLRPLTEFACDRFIKFVKGFKQVRDVNYMIGNFHSDVFVQNGRRNFVDADVGKSFIEISSQNASEMFSKYFYAEKNLPVELSEQFGIWTLREYKKILTDLGFTVKHAETFLLDYLLKEHYSKDFEVFHLKNGVLSNAPYPPSTMLLVGEKQ
ncbi:MAG: methyltransferase domain-containing protein [Candidatus Woesebacteria bacterium]|nr:MAG: methyltransferase domain-containing protein [Candidatus Woesebacteria bacterium]